MSKKLDALLKNFGTETVAVIHNDHIELGVHRVRPVPPVTVALVTVDKKISTDDKLEKAFMLTNSIDDAWWNNKDVTKMFDGDSCRSTSVGDMVLIGTMKYKCESSGWSEVS